MKTLAVTSENAEELPAVLPGIDINKAITQLGISNSAFKKILLGFLRNNLSSEKSLNDAYNEKNWDSLKVLAHSIKGSGRNIGANDLGDVAHELEIASKNGNATPPEQELVEKVIATLRQVLQSLQMLADTQEAEESKQESFDIQQLTDDLRQLAEAIDVAQPNKIEMFFAAVKKQLNTQTIQELENQLDCFEYDEALETVNKIAEENKIKLS